MAFGRSAIQSSVIALFMLQQRGQTAPLLCAFAGSVVAGAQFPELPDFLSNGAEIADMKSLLSAAVTTFEGRSSSPAQQ
jgi:hypothetical protein